MFAIVSNNIVAIFLIFVKIRACSQCSAQKYNINTKHNNFFEKVDYVFVYVWTPAVQEQN